MRMEFSLTTGTLPAACIRARVPPFAPDDAGEVQRTDPDSVNFRSPRIMSFIIHPSQLKASCARTDF